MARHRIHSTDFKRQVARDYLDGETLYSLANRHGLSRNPIRIWVRKYEDGAFDEDAQAAKKQLGGPALNDLYQNERKLRQGALALLSRSRLDTLLTGLWGAFAVVGSVDLDLMTWRDIDLHVCAERSEAERFLSLVPMFSSACSAAGLTLVKVSFNNEYVRPANAFGEGLYLGFRVLDANDLWKIDLWAWSARTFERKQSEHEALKARLANADRGLILRTKAAVHDRPEYRDSITSLDIYEFALANAGRTVAEFERWLAWRNA